MVILGLGSNLGDRRSNLAQAIAKLRAHATIESVSTAYESAAMLPPDAPREWNKPFLNLAVKIRTGLSPRELLHALKEIEKALGRARRERWAPREIDLDILAWDDLMIHEADLKIPHPGLLERPFALRPLAELVPGWNYPVPGPHFGQTAQALSATTEAEPYDAPELVGIVNVTPDSFSDGGHYFSAEKAAAQARTLALEGANVIDVGAESTRPGAHPLSPEDEWKRLEPALGLLRSSFKDLNKKPLLSVDTRNAAVAKRALEFGIDWINDVSGFRDPEMQKVAQQSDVDLVVMHSLSVPAARNVVFAANENAVEEVLRWAQLRFGELEKLGINRNRLIFDPGVGFGKTPAHSLALLAGAGRFRELGARVLVGHSRKSFLSKFTAKPFSERDPETVTASLELARKGVNYLRVHNVAAHAQAFELTRALRNVSQCH